MICRKTRSLVGCSLITVKNKRPRVERWWMTLARVRRGVWDGNRDSWERAEQLAPPSCKPPPGRPPHSCSALASPRHATWSTGIDCSLFTPAPYTICSLLYYVIHRSLVTVPARHCGTDAAWNRGRSNKAGVVSRYRRLQPWKSTVTYLAAIERIFKPWMPTKQSARLSIYLVNTSTIWWRNWHVYGVWRRCDIIMCPPEIAMLILTRNNTT